MREIVLKIRKSVTERMSVAIYTTVTIYYFLLLTYPLPGKLMPEVPKAYIPAWGSFGICTWSTMLPYINLVKSIFTL
jgi:hypothetical protein